MPDAELPSAGRGRTVRTGTDVQAISAFDEFDPEVGSRIKERVFAESERAYCERTGYPAQHYAARWAAKEAFVKLVGRLRGFTYDGVRVATTDSGPYLDLSEAAAEALRDAFEETTSVSLDLSLSHDRDADIAMATVVGLVGHAEGDDDR